MINLRRHIRGLRFALANASALVACTTVALAGDSADPITRDFAMSSGALNEALRQFSDQSGVSIIYDHRIVSGRTAPAVSGPLTTSAVLDALLDGTSLEYRRIDSRTLAIVERRETIDAIPAPPLNDLNIYNERPRIDEIIVTTSYRAPGVHAGLRVDYTLDAEVLNLSGAQSIAEPIHELPTTVASVSSTNTQLLVSAGGLNLADLRGLGPKRSLTLINGRRLVRTSGGNSDIYGVDLNAIPTQFIDRVEVIGQAAGSTLGGDAVGGAVNIALRDHIDGVSLNIHGGVSERGDAAEYSLAMFAGREFAGGKGKLSGGVVYAMDPSLFFTDRDYLARPFGFALDGRRAQAAQPGAVFTPGFGGSSFTPAGMIAGGVAANGDVMPLGNPDDQFSLVPGGYENFDGSLHQLYNWVEGFSAMPEIDRVHSYVRADYEVSDAISLSGEFFFADVETDTQIAATPLAFSRGVNMDYGDSILVPADHPNAPPGLRDAVESATGGPIEHFLINRRVTELGPRRREIDRQTLDFNLGADIDLGSDWTLSASYTFGRVRTNDSEHGLVDAERITIAVDPDRCAATPDCIPLNIFDAQNVPASVADYYRLAPRLRTFTTTEHIARVSAAGPIYELGDHEGRVSAGVEYRRDALDDQGNASQPSAPALGGFEAPSSAGSVGYSEIFAGADLPLRAQTAPGGAVVFGADARLTRWTGGEFVANISGDLSWAPTPGLELYAFALYGGRAPNTVELFSAGLGFAELTFDPCNAPTNEIVIANCANSGPLGTPSGFSQTVLLPHYPLTGNSTLDHEKVHSRHFGIAADIQDFIYLNENALRVTADWRFHRITNSIEELSLTSIAETCYHSAGLSSSLCGVNPATGNLFIQRNASTGDIQRIERTFLNGGEMETSGLDATLAYRGELLWAPLSPSFSLDVLYSYAHKMNSRGVFENIATEQVGLTNFPRHQLYTTASLETDRWKTLWTVRRRGSVQTLDIDIAEARFPATTYVDAGVQFRPSNNVIIFGGVENLFDKDLPVAAFGERGFFAEFYDVIGRRYFAGVKAEF